MNIFLENGKLNKKLCIVLGITAVMIILVLIGLIKVIAGGEDEIGENKKNPTELSVTPNPQEGDDLDTQPTLVPSTPTPIPTKAPTGPMIAIDAGHGGEKSPGSNRGDLYEKDATLAIALFLKEILETRGYQTYMIRETDIAVEDKTRPGLAKENGAVVYVSLHLNSWEKDSNSVQGAEVWYSDLLDNDSDVLSQYIIDEIATSTGAKNRGIKVSNRFTVLKENTLPACLIQCGFITSEAESTKLFNEEYQKLMAEGIANGIEKFLPLETE